MKRKRHHVSLIERVCAIFMLGLLFAASLGLVIQAITTWHFVQLVLSLGFCCFTAFLLSLGRFKTHTISRASRFALYLLLGDRRNARRNPLHWLRSPGVQSK